MNRIVKTKVCKICSEEKPFFEYMNVKSNADGLMTRCRDCWRKTRKLTEGELLQQRVGPASFKVLD